MYGAWQGLVEAMAEGLDIRYGARVTKVCWGDGGAAVFCSDSRRFTADAVIMTVSLGVLKACSPPLTILTLNTQEKPCNAAASLCITYTHCL